MLFALKRKKILAHGQNLLSEISGHKKTNACTTLYEAPTVRFIQTESRRVITKDCQ